MIIVGGINMITALLVLILERTQMIGLLKALGSNNWSIRKIFLYQGILMTLIGGVIGLIIGYALVQLQLSFKLIMITPVLSYPVALQFKNFVIVMLTLMVLGIIASRIAASRINRDLVKTS